MKKLITICLLMTISLSVNAQNLSKEETVAYINKSLKNITGKEYKSNRYYLDCKVLLEDDEVSVTMNFDRNNFVKYNFNPKSITYITDMGSRNYFIISFNKKIEIADFRYTKSASSIYEDDSITFPYDSSSGDLLKIRKALLYLKSLYEADKDPFEN